MPSRSPVTRRDVLGTVSALGGLALVHSALGKAGSLTLTPAQTAGPFYPSPRPLEQDMDLTMLAGHTERAKGQLLDVAGRVMDRDGKPVAGATVEIWQANSYGRYDHPKDINPAPLDPNFQGFGVLTTDAQGRYRFKTIKPGAYPINPVNPTAVRTPHIHFDVAQGTRKLVTQMYFPNEPLNASDRIFATLGAAQAAAICQVAPEGATGEPEAMQIHWDIILAT